MEYTRHLQVSLEASEKAVEYLKNKITDSRSTEKIIELGKRKGKLEEELKQVEADLKVEESKPDGGVWKEDLKIIENWIDWITSKLLQMDNNKEKETENIDPEGPRTRLRTARVVENDAQTSISATNENN